MKKTSALIIFLISLLYNSLWSQVLRNDGSLYISGGYVVINGNYQNENSGDLTLNGTVLVTGNWINNASNPVMNTPDGSGMLIFDGGRLHNIGGSGSSPMNFEGITINAADTVEVTAGFGITAYGNCTFNSPLILKTTSGFHPKMATFINQGSVAGNISMEFNYTSTGSSAAGTGRGIYFSSPVSNATAGIFNVAAGSNLLWYQNEILRKYIKVTANTTPLTVSKGYILRAPASGTYLFTGPANDAASYTASGIPRVDSAHYYLLGNPYPSVVDWQTVSKTNIGSTIWYQTCNAAGAMRVDTWNSFNLTGTNNNGIAYVDGKIAPMQSFWIQVDADGNTGTVTFNNTDRTHDWGSAPFLKSYDLPEREVMRLYLFTGNQKDEEVLIQNDSAKDEFDPWDSQKRFLADTSLAEIYTLSPEGHKLVIQSVKPASQDKIIPVGLLNTKIGCEYKFEADLSSSLPQYDYYLEDKRLNVIQSLKLSPQYSFISDAEKDTVGDRFVIHLMPSQANIVPNGSTVNEQQINIYSYNKTVFIERSPVGSDVSIYNIVGQLMYRGTVRSDREIIPCDYMQGIYIVKVMNKTSNISQRVLIK